MKTTSLLALASLFFLAACNVGGIRGNGHRITKERAVPDFRNIETDGAFEVEWRRGAPSLRITTDENLMRYISSKVADGVLRLKSDQSLNPRHGIRVLVTSKMLEAAKLDGASRLEVHGVEGARFFLESNGAAKVIADGAVNELLANMNGASNLQGESLRTKTADLTLNGAGRAVVAVSDSLTVSIAGAGKVEYIGNPSHIERSIAGAGSIRKRD